MIKPFGDMQENIIDETNVIAPETPIYRVFSRQRFLELIITKKNSLVKPSMWEDPFENAFLQCTAIMEKGEEASLERIRAKWYGQCWTTERDTDAMWRIYSHNKDGVRVKTTVGKIIRALWGHHKNTHFASSCFVGKVEYKTKEDIEEFLSKSYVQHFLLNGRSLAKTLLMKRREFRHEEEVRILFQDINHETDRNIYQYPIELNNILEEVTLDPRANSEDVEMLAALLSEQGISAPVNKSNLYSFAPMRIKFAPDGHQLPITQMS